MFKNKEEFHMSVFIADRSGTEKDSPLRYPLDLGDPHISHMADRCDQRGY